MTTPSPRRATRPVPDCGTTAAYERHKRLGERPCAACRQAKTDYVRALRHGTRQRQKVRQDKGVPRPRVQRDAETFMCTPAQQPLPKPTRRAAQRAVAAWALRQPGDRTTQQAACALLLDILGLSLGGTDVQPAASKGGRAP